MTRYILPRLFKSIAEEKAAPFETVKPQKRRNFIDLIIFKDFFKEITEGLKYSVEIVFSNQILCVSEIFVVRKALKKNSYGSTPFRQKIVKQKV